MTKAAAVAVLAVLLIVLYLLMYAGWARRARRHPAAVAAASPTATLMAPLRAGNLAAENLLMSGALPGEPPGVQLSVPGVYVTTTTAHSRLDRVTAAGLGARAAATMHVDDSTVRWQRDGAADVVVPTAWLRSVCLERGMAGKWLGSRRLVVVAWLDPTRDDSQEFATGFLPRYAADRDTVLSALQALLGHGGATGTPHRDRRQPPHQPPHPVPAPSATTPDGAL